MSRALAPLLLAALCAAQGVSGLRQASGASFSGFGDDAKAEKTWEIRAASVRPEPGAEEGVWRLETIELVTLRDGKPFRTLRTPAGVARPDQGSADGEGALTLEGEGIRLAGIGWNWRGTPQGDTFALRSLVRGTVGQPGRSGGPAQVAAKRMDASPAAAGGTSLTFAGGVEMTRGSERLTTDQLVLALDGSGALRSWVAAGGVVHEADGRRSRADEVRRDEATGETRFLGAVEVADPRLRLVCSAVTRRPDGSWRAEDPELVRVELAAAEGRPAARLAARALAAQPAADGASLLVAQGSADYASGDTRLQADTLRLLAPAKGRGWVEALGGARGTDGSLAFEAGQARSDPGRDELLLQGEPRLADRRGFALSGFQIRARPAVGAAEVLSGIGRRAALRAVADGEPVEAEADRIDVARSPSLATARLAGAVRLRMGEAEAASERLELRGKLAQGKEKEGSVELDRLALEGGVTYRSPGLAARAGRAELHPAVGLETEVAAELGGAARLLLLLPGAEGEDAALPRLELAEGGSVVAVAAPRHEILLSRAAARFHSEGGVRLGASGAEGACARLQGLARRDPEGRLALVSALGEGEVELVGGGNRATGRRLELDGPRARLLLRGDARVVDRQGREGLPADAIAYDLRGRNWSMESAPAGPDGRVTKPRILLPGTGLELPLPQ